MRGYHKRREVKNCRKAREDKIKRERRTAGAAENLAVCQVFSCPGKAIDAWAF